MTTTTNDISSSDDLIDVRDVIATVEALREARDAFVGDAVDVTAAVAAWAEDEPDDAETLIKLEALLSDLEGNGGDEQWNGDWYPVTLIRDSYFEDHARELAEECGMIPSDNKWPCTCIDWEKAARELRMDYSTTEFDGVTYWYR